MSYGYSLAAGFMLLRGEWKEAVMAVLAARDEEPPGVRQARTAIEAGDWARALELMPRHMVAERCILEVCLIIPADAVDKVWRHDMQQVATIRRLSAARLGADTTCWDTSQHKS
jgi:hypothetical protein